MKGWIIAAGILAFLILLLFLPFHLTVAAEDGVSVKARLLIFRVSVYPTNRRKKPKKTKKKSSPAEKKKKKSGGGGKKQSIPEMLRLILKIAEALIRKLSRHLRIRVCRYEISVATDDAAKTAVLYGAASGLTANLFDLLRSVANFKVKANAPVNVYADFLSEKSRLAIKIDFSITLLGALAVLLSAGLAFVKQKRKR